MNAAPTEAFGPYLVYEQLGIGGMAQVHRAELATTGGYYRPVALKRMLPHVADDEDMVQAFVREARLASHLRHINVAEMYEVGKVGGTYFIAMELITGRNLREILKQAAETTGPMPVAVALNIINQLCDALDYAHNLCDDAGTPLNIIHRDVSPSNIIVATDGVLKLIDFGIAKTSERSMQTLGGQLKGKFGYMAPEYLAGTLDARADLFAIGVIAHELLTNQPLFTANDDISTMQRVRSMSIKPPSRINPQVPAEVDEIVMTALERDPDNRWQHATALRNAMTTVTQRNGLVVSNAQVLDWVDWLFEQTKKQAQVPRGMATSGGLAEDARTEGCEDEVYDEPSISIERAAVEPPEDFEEADPPTLIAHGTPRSHATVDPANRRHDALAPSSTRWSADLIPAEQRISAQSISEQRIAEQRIAEQRIAEQRISSQRISSQRISSQRISSQRISTQRMSSPNLSAPKSSRPETLVVKPAGTDKLLKVLIVLLAALIVAAAVYLVVPELT